MPLEIDFYFDFISPYTYLAHTVLPRLAAGHKAQINYNPFMLPELMKMVGNRPTTIECENKGVYVMSDLQRWAARYRTKFAPNPHWQTIDFAKLGRGALAAIDEGNGVAYADAVFAALWGETLDLSKHSVLTAVLSKAGLDGARLLDHAASAEYAARLEQSTAGAAKRGVFGSPAMFVGSEMFFGNDRLDFLAAALKSAA